MNILNRISQAFKINKQSKSFSVIVSNLLLGKVPPPQETKDFEELYRDFSWVYSGIFAISTACARVPLKLIQIKNGKGVEIENSLTHSAMRIFSPPNGTMSYYDLIEGIMIYLETTGNAFLEIGKNRIGQDMALYLLRPDRIRIIPDKKGKGVEKYIFTLEGESGKIIKAQEFKPKDILHFKYFSPIDDWWGQGSIQAAKNAVVLEQYAIKHNEAFFEGGGVPPGLLKFGSGISKKEAKKVYREWQNRDKTTNVAAVSAEVGFQELGSGGKDMEFAELRRMNREEILSTLGVPPAMVGILEQAKYENYQLQRKLFNEDTIVPKMLKVESTLNSFLMPRFGEDLRYRFDFTDLLAESESEKQQKIEKLMPYGIYTPNEARQALGLDPFEGGDIRYIDSRLIPVDEDLESIRGEEAAKMQEKGKLLATDIRNALHSHK